MHRSEQAAPSASVNLSFTVQVIHPSGIPVLTLQAISLNMKYHTIIGLYTLFAVSYALPSNQVVTTKFNILSDSTIDTTRNVHEVQNVGYLSPVPLSSNPTDLPQVKPEGSIINGFAY